MGTILLGVVVWLLTLFVAVAVISRKVLEIGMKTGKLEGRRDVLKEESDRMKATREQLADVVRRDLERLLTARKTGHIETDFMTRTEMERRWKIRANTN